MDQMHARAMQTALWPATFGYWMDTLFTPNPGTTSDLLRTRIEQTREFFTSLCLRPRTAAGDSHRRTALRDPADDGVLADPVVSRGIFRELLSQSFLASLYSLLRHIDTDWTTLSQNAAWIGKAAILTRRCSTSWPHPSSVEYFSRNAESLALLFNMLNRFGLGPAWSTALSNQIVQTDPVALLQQLGYTGTALPDLLNHFFLTDNPQITTIIDDRPLSETDSHPHPTPTTNAITSSG